MYEGISQLIEQGQLARAAELLPELIEKEGFNDTIAIYAATINAGFGDVEGFISMVERGLAHNSSNYELHLMKGNYLEDKDLNAAFDQYDLALAHAFYKRDEKPEDYEYIESFVSGFKREYSEEFKKYTDSLPILFYKTEPICYDLLNHFVDKFSQALENAGESVEIIDVNITPIEELTSLMGKRYKAIIGIQSYIFSVALKDGRNLHDFILGPKFNMVFDHPACMYSHFSKGPRDYTILTHDRNYEAFIKKYYPYIQKVAILPPGGEWIEEDGEREYGLVFVGTYHSPGKWDGVIKDLDRKYNNKAGKLLDYIKANPNKTYEECAEYILGKDLDIEALYDLKQTYFSVMSYYRERIVKTILDGGVKLHVFGDSWREPVWEGYANLIIHPELSTRESMEVYGKSLASLNIMSWHKDGRTERVENSMLSGAVVVTDKTRYLEENYVDGEDIILFDLEDFSSLPQRIEDLLLDENRCRNMAKLAKEKALLQDLWEVRSKDFLQILESVHHF